KPYSGIGHECIVKGDGKMMSIAAASILAKTHRDEFMKRIHEEYPQYAWNINKGYPTKAHRAAIEQYGTTPYHRLSFRLIDRLPSLFE
ncbi:MAG: ribonuclease HII, partial [Bacteroidales bacterium]|nr:ribonuclease HII [Bacteroidales bacterium]